MNTLYMKRMAKGLFLSLSMALIGISSVDAALTKDFYTTTSVLSTGNWVKVGVEQTGVYEISYQELEGMGFSDPSKVAVYGRGGRVLPESFVSNSGIPILTDDLTPVKIIHEDNKIYFYGLGPEEIAYETDDKNTLGGYFVKRSNNIYSKRGYYFLTDSRDIDKMKVLQYSTSSAKEVEKGLSYLYHEVDLVQNTTMSGQLFWGERIGLPGEYMMKWPVEMPDAIEGEGVMSCELYFHDGEFGDNATVAYGFENTDVTRYPYKPNTSLNYTPHDPALTNITVPGTKGNVFVEFTGEDIGRVANLDFWVVTYQRGIPTMMDSENNAVPQQLIALPDIARNTTGRMDLKDPASLVVLDITTPDTPERLQVSQTGAVGTVGIKNTGKTPVVVVFDKDQTQLKIAGYEEAYSKVENQNLHGYKEKGADFIIITPPSLKEYAEEIAQLHRDYDGIEVVVATTEDLYNEFSGGVPDPMAYRNFAKMLYMSNRKPKNILLFGPLYSDFRGLQTERDPFEGIIAYQSPQVSITRGAHNINDFYGMMGDKFRVDYYERNEVHMGVGILPVKFPSEARIVIDKIQNYLKRTDHAYFLNKYTAIGGLYDDHTHEIQVRDINNHIRQLDNTGTVFTPISIDSYGNAEAQKKLFNMFNEGCNTFSYFGHGAEQFLGKDRNFFNAGDVFKLRNSVHPFALFGGCQITNSDRGFRGLGETLVTATPYGCIGSIVSARDTWSGQNYEFFKQFFTCLYTQGSTASSAHRTNPVTIGEVYASVKNYSTYSNELSYQLLCDPAIIFPIINRSVAVQQVGNGLLPGDKFWMVGTIRDASGKTDTGFNGQLVVRLNEPERTVKAEAIETGNNTNSPELKYRDNQVSMATADVKNGEFTVEIHVPSSMSVFEGEEALIYFSAYDPKTKIGAGHGYKVKVGAAEANSAESSDNVSPLIENLSFDNNKCSISLTVSDNVALNLSNNPLSKGLYLYIDGKERSEAHFVEPILENSRAAYSKEILLSGLSYGDHTARLKVKDVAGNSAETEIAFTFSPITGAYSIIRSTESNPEYTRIQVEGVVPASAEIVILSDNGEEIWRGQLEKGYIDWNHTSQDGKVKPGHYKAYLIETGTGTTKGHSETIDIPVI